MNFTMSKLWASNITLSYGKNILSKNLSVTIPDNEITVIIGPNACGKSTLLRILGRLIVPREGKVWLDGSCISSYSTKEVARKLTILPQHYNIPLGIKVKELVSLGRYPHQKLFSQWSKDDETAVCFAMEVTNTHQLANQDVNCLSGGQRQRALIAMVIAQSTPLILLDEPTTWLDINYQIELLELIQILNTYHKKTLIVVLHDLNHACRYATHLIAMYNGNIISEGKPKTIINSKLIEKIYGLKSIIIQDPITNTPIVIPCKKNNFL